MSQLEAVAEDFIQKYLLENDYRYAGEEVSLKQSFQESKEGRIKKNY